MVTATGNATLAANAKQLVTELAACQEANAAKYPKFGPGYLSGFPTHYFDCLENLWHRPCRYMQVGSQMGHWGGFVQSSVGARTHDGEHRSGVDW